MNHDRMPAIPSPEDTFDFPEVERRPLFEAGKAFTASSEPLGGLRVRNIPEEIVRAHGIPYDRIQVVHTQSHPVHGGMIAPESVAICGTRQVAHSLELGEGVAEAIFGSEDKMVVLNDESAGDPAVAIPGVDLGISIERETFMKFNLNDGRMALGEPDPFTEAEIRDLAFAVQDAVLAEV